MHKDNLSILIPDGESHLALPVTRCLAHINGIKVHVLSRDPWSNVRFSRYCSSFTYFDGALGDESILRAITRVAQRVNANILLPVSEPGIRFASARRRELQEVVVSQVPPLDAFDTVIDKWSFADFMQTHDIPTPQTILLRKDAGSYEQMGNLKFPVLLKPTKSTNGNGIIQFDNRASLVHFLEAPQNDSCEYIIQKLVSGYDIDCSVLCRDGEILAYTIQKGIIPNQQRFRPPFAIEFLQHEEVLKVASKLVGALSWNGVAHIDMMVDTASNRVMVIELNPRYWGSLLGSLRAGVNFPYLAVIAGLRQSLPQASYRNIRYIEPYAALQLIARRSFVHVAGGFNFSESGWGYLLADPLAAVVGKIRSLLKSIQ